MSRRQKMRKIFKLNLQLFGEGGGTGAGPASGDSTGNGSSGAEGAGVNSEFAAPTGRANSLENVIYGTAAQDIANPESGETAKTPKEKAQSFEDLIKGEYKEEYQKRIQKNINERFKDYQNIQNQLKSQNDIISRLSEKYGVQGNLEALAKAIDADESFYEQEALERGVSVETLKEIKTLERQVQQYQQIEQTKAQEEAGQKLYGEWIEQGNALAQKYGIADFDLNAEIDSNPEFVSLLRSGVSVEGAYKAIHFDDMLTGAMATTANTVKQQMANNIASRNARPMEGGASSQTSQVFKQDVNALTKADRAEIMKRVARGAIISF